MTCELVECEWNGKVYLGKVNNYGIAVVVSPLPEVTDDQSSESETGHDKHDQ